MKLDKDGKAIYAIDQEGGTLYVIDLSEDSLVPQLVASDLGLLTDVDVAPGRPTLITDATGKRVVEIDCSQGEGCSEPAPFAAIPEFERPITVTRTADDTVWVGDFDAQSIFAFDADGNLIEVLRSMSGFDE